MRGSEFYGIQHVLYKHASIPDPWVFPYAVQHGWQNVPTRFEADGQPVELWAWSSRIAREMGEFFDPGRIRVVGSPYLYLPTLIERPTPPSGAIYILPHSSHFARIGFSHDDLRDLLTSIRAKCGRCDVLVYYLDIDETLCTLLREVGARILVNGGLWSRDFLYRFRENIRDYEHLYYSSFGSGVLFARHEGLLTEYVQLESRKEFSSNPHLNSIEAVAFDHEGAHWDTDEELGSSHVLSPGELRRLILHGLSSSVLPKLPRKWAGNLRNAMRDYRVNVRPALRLVAAYNRAPD